MGEVRQRRAPRRLERAEPKSGRIAAKSRSVWKATEQIRPAKPTEGIRP